MTDTQRIAIVREPGDTQIVIDCKARPTEIHSHRVFGGIYRKNPDDPKGPLLTVMTPDQEFCAFVEEHVRLHVSAAECDCGSYLAGALAVYQGSTS